MSPAQKKVIDDHCTTEWAAKFADPWGDFEHAGLAKVKAMPDHEVYPITNAQLTSGRSRRSRCGRSGPTTYARPEAIRRDHEGAQDRARPIQSILLSQEREARMKIRGLLIGAALAALAAPAAAQRQDLQTETVALGAGDAPLAKDHGGVGRVR